MGHRIIVERGRIYFHYRNMSAWRRCMRITTMIMLFVLLTAMTAQAATDWTSWKFYLGEWKAESVNQLGKNVATLTFKTDLQGEVLIRRNHNEYGDKKVHEDMLIIRPDSKDSKHYQADYYDNESHVIRYDVVTDGTKIVFTSVDNTPGPRFRMTFEPKDKDRYNTKFEIAPPGKDFQTYVEGDAVRKK
jgi:hypothetical protein